MSIEAMKQALEALENWLEFDPENFGATDNRAVTALRQAIEQAEKHGQWGASSVTKPEYVAEQKEKTKRALDLMAENARELGLDYEPVQVKNPSEGGDCDSPSWCNQYGKCHRKVVGAPTLANCMEEAERREWVGLTDEDIAQFETWCDEEEERKGWVHPKLMANYFEAKLKERNHDQRA